MSTRHLSYRSTDLFSTEIPTANPNVAFLPSGPPSLLWEMPIYIQSHKAFPIQIIGASVTKKVIREKFNSAATNCPSGQARQNLTSARHQLVRLSAQTGDSPSALEFVAESSPQATNWWDRQATSISLRGATPSRLPALPSFLMGVWNTQIEPRSG
ncbi:hypothetical protein EYB25_010097 [Talaromyces marneffei]|nr:hypothetical protein EYB25_010097 [Talaromyces marneffei]